jgi:hypothetical protein
MEYKLEIGVGLLVLTVSIVIYFFIKRKPDENKEAQRLLNEYLERDLSTSEIGLFYERYIGHLYEQKGYHVKFHGAVNGFEDLGRDLIVTGENEIFIIQAKCWSKKKLIHEKHIFQLYGSMEHFKRTHNLKGKVVKAVFFASTYYSDAAERVAKDLGVELYNEHLEKKYPLIKCNVNQRGEKIYHLPFDPYYDKIRIDTSDEKVYVYTVEEAVARGFRRARNKHDEAA